MYYNYGSQDKYVPRLLFLIDLEPGTMFSVKAGPLGEFIKLKKKLKICYFFI